MGKSRVPQSQYASQGYQRTGWNHWVDYNPTTDTLKYGDWQVNPSEIGVKRVKASFDPNTLKRNPNGTVNIEDIWKGLGATDESIANFKHSGFFPTLYGQKAKSPFGDGGDWMMSIANNIKQMLDPKRAMFGLGISGGYGDVKSAPYFSIKANQDFNVTPFNPRSRGGNIFNPLTSMGTAMGGGIAGDMSNIGAGLRLTPSWQQDSKRIYKGDDGNIWYEYKQGLPQDEKFARDFQAYVNNLAKSGVDMVHGKDPSGTGNDPRGNSSPGQGKKPTILGG